MKKVVDLNDYRIQSFTRQCFGPWQKRFGEKFTLTTRLKDISDHTLYRLAYPGEESTLAFYELIMGVLKLGPTTQFGYLDDDNKMRVIDSHLFLADNARFELMRRLDWLKSYAVLEENLVTLVQETEKFKIIGQDQIPELSASHSEFERYQKLVPRDRDAFIRRLLTSALEEFKSRI